MKNIIFFFKKTYFICFSFALLASFSLIFCHVTWAKSGIATTSEATTVSMTWTGPKRETVNNNSARSQTTQNQAPNATKSNRNENNFTNNASNPNSNSSAGKSSITAAAPVNPNYTNIEIPVFNTNTVLKNLLVPWEIRFLAKDNWLITERPGYLTILKGTTVKRFKIPEVDQIGEGGLLGLAIHPDYETNHWIYLYRTTQKNGKNINQVLRYKLENNSLTQETIIIDDIPANSIHNGGRIAFGPDKYLYVTTGDAAQPALAQDKNSLAGKILRVDDHGKIPAENPFNNAIFSYGHRNPQGIAWDDKERLWATEHGPTGYDKLYLIQAGKNYGWPTNKGYIVAKGVEKAVLNSGANVTWAPAGLAFWNSKLYFGGLKGEGLYEVDISSTPVKLTKYFENDFGRIRAVNVGVDQALYFTTSNQDGRASKKNPEDDVVIRIPRPRNPNDAENAKIEADFPVSNSFR